MLYIFQGHDYTRVPTDRAIVQRMTEIQVTIDRRMKRELVSSLNSLSYVSKQFAHLKFRLLYCLKYILVNFYHFCLFLFLNFTNEQN